jgi:hypothetical protein
LNYERICTLSSRSWLGDLIKGGGVMGTLKIWQSVSHNEMILRGYEFLYQTALSSFYSKGDEFVQVCCGLVVDIHEEK